MAPVDRISAELSEIFGDRLRMVASFGPDGHVCAVVESITAADLERCAGFFGGSSGWNKAGVGPPLLVAADELKRALDAFPLEFNEIISTRRMIAGTDFFAGVAVPVEDVRRACEVQARGHLLHLREGYIEAAGDRKAIARLLKASQTPFHALVSNIARLDGITPADLISRLGLKNDGFAEALGAAERLVEHVDRWRRT